MKKIILTSFLGLSIFTTTAINAETFTIDNPKKVVVSVNGVDKTEEDLYNQITMQAGFQPSVDVLDLKVMSEQFKDQSKLNEIIEKLYKEKLEANKEEDPNLTLDYKLYNANNKEEYIEKSGIKLNAYRTLAEKKTAAEQIFTQDEKNYIYNNRFSATEKLYAILIEPKLENPNESDQSVIDSALASALKEAKDLRQSIATKDNFKEVAKEKNKLFVDGYLGEFDINSARSAGLDSALVDEAFKLKDKEISMPIQTQYGYYLLYAEQTKEKPSMDSVSEQINQILYDMYTQDNPYLADYALFLYRADNKITLNNNLDSRLYANSYLQAKKQYLQYTPNDYSNYNFGEQ